MRQNADTATIFKEPHFLEVCHFKKTPPNSKIIVHFFTVCVNNGLKPEQVTV